MADLITEARQTLADDLAAVCTVPTLSGLPPALVPPLNVLVPADPWLTDATVMGSPGTVHHDVICIAGTALDADALEALARQVLEVCVAVPFDQVSGPQRREYGGRLYLTATITLTTPL